MASQTLDSQAVTNEKEDQSYDRPPIQVDTENNRIILRASQASSCRRQLAYHARGYKVTNPPDNVAINRMLAGTYLEAVAVDYLKRTQWTDVKSFQDDYKNPPFLNIKLSDKIFVTGIPDAHGRHERYTDNKLAVIEIKTRGNAAWSQMEKMGAMGAFPSAIAQIAFYRKGLLDYQKEHNLHLIDPDSTGCLVSLNTDTKIVKEYQCSNINLESTLTDLTSKLVSLTSLLLDSETKDDKTALPAKDYSYDSWQCKSCPFFSQCQEKPTNQTPNNPKHPQISRTEAINALHTYEEAHSQVTNNSDLDAQKATARETLLNFLKAEQLEQTEFLSRSGLSKRVKIQKRSSTQIDLEQLSGLLSKEQYDSVVHKKVTESVRIW